MSPRSTHPTATIAVNDCHRTLVTVDLHRNETLSAIPLPLDPPLSTTLQFSHRIVNSTALSPCTRQRLLVGDFPGAIIVDARRPSSVLTTLPTSPSSFAAAWSEDAWSVATTSDDGSLKLWDARMWRVVREWEAWSAPVRTVRFSKLGGGPMTLFAAEALDYVHVVDVASAQEVQVLDFFGEVAGMEVGSDGGELLVGNGDVAVGGISVFARTRWSNTGGESGVVRDWDGRWDGRWGSMGRWGGSDQFFDFDLI
jgi:WD40 repeat protein